MCGILCVFNKEAKPDEKVYDTLFKWAEKRGTDGVGFAWIRRDYNQSQITKWPGSYSNDLVSKFIRSSCRSSKIGDLIIGITRARPETENESSTTNMQPLVYKEKDEEIILVHNGAVSNRTYKQYEGIGYNTTIDSEAIIHAYLHHDKNMKDTCENIIAGFAFIMYDKKRDRLFICSNHGPIAHAYDKSMGIFMAHSDNNALAEVIEEHLGVNRCGVNVWEQYYFHDLRPYTIYEYDLQSGFETSYSFEPNYRHPVWDNLKKTNDKEKVLVIASGGIDSSLTALTLKKCGYDVELVHFNLNQNAEKEELWAIEKISQQHDMKLKIFDIGGFYKDINDPSMLNKDKDIPVGTGSTDEMKSTYAWQAFRNGIFIALLTAYAESLIFQNDYKNIYIAHGFSQLTEEGNFPDNSGRFIKASKSFINLGSLCGHRIKLLNVMENIMKSDEIYLGNKLGLKFEYTCSCDNPRLVAVEIDEIYDYRLFLCSNCGSTKMSQWAFQIAGIKDPRYFYSDDEYEKIFKNYCPADLKVEYKDASNIIERLILPSKEDYNILKSLLIT